MLFLPLNSPVACVLLAYTHLFLQKIEHVVIWKK